jgi:thiol peroxidase
MEIIIDGNTVPLKEKERPVGAEAPACRLKMRNGETKVIGMMADKVQMIVTIPAAEDISKELLDIMSSHNEKANIYLVCSDTTTVPYLECYTSHDFEKLSRKFGVYIDDALCAKSIFIINKEGEIVYKEIVGTLTDGFDTAACAEHLQSAIAFKKKGHTHENWMGV